MIKRWDNIDASPDREAARIAHASDEEVRDQLRRGMIERRLSRLVRSLNALEQQSPTRELARRALHRLGFPTT
jgi:hypothetical protein